MNFPALIYVKKFKLYFKEFCTIIKEKLKELIQIKFFRTGKFKSNIDSKWLKFNLKAEIKINPKITN